MLGMKNLTRTNCGSSTYLGINVDFLKDVLQDPPIRGATQSCQVSLFRRVDGDQGMLIWGDEEFMEIRD